MSPVFLESHTFNDPGNPINGEGRELFNSVADMTGSVTGWL